MAHVALTVPHEYTNRAVEAIKEVGVEDLSQTVGHDTVIEFEIDDPKRVTGLGLFAIIDCSVRITP